VGRPDGASQKRQGRLPFITVLPRFLRGKSGVFEAFVPGEAPENPAPLLAERHLARPGAGKRETGGTFRSCRPPALAELVIRKAGPGGKASRPALRLPGDDGFRKRQGGPGSRKKSSLLQLDASAISHLLPEEWPTSFVTRGPRSCATAVAGTVGMVSRSRRNRRPIFGQASRPGVSVLLPRYIGGPEAGRNDNSAVRRGRTAGSGNPGWTLYCRGHQPLLNVPRS